MSELKHPNWTLNYNIVSSDSEWIGTGWEFFNEEEHAQNRYDVLTKSGIGVCKRPYYHHTDKHHLGACHLNLINKYDMFDSPKWKSNNYANNTGTPKQESLVSCTKIFLWKCGFCKQLSSKALYCSSECWDKWHEKILSEALDYEYVKIKREGKGHYAVVKRKKISPLEVRILNRVKKWLSK